jgi:hypothetical protein
LPPKVRPRPPLRRQRQAALERVEFALEIAEAQVLPEVTSHALNTKGRSPAAARGERSSGRRSTSHSSTTWSTQLYSAYNNLIVTFSNSTGAMSESSGDRGPI